MIAFRKILNIYRLLDLAHSLNPEFHVYQYTYNTVSIAPGPQRRRQARSTRVIYQSDAYLRGCTSDSPRSSLAKPYRLRRIAWTVMKPPVSEGWKSPISSMEDC